MIMITALPSKLNVVTASMARHRLFVFPDNHSECRPNCRDAPQSIRPLLYCYDSMNMIWHYNKQWHLYIEIVGYAKFS